MNDDSAVWNDHQTKYLKPELLWKAQEVGVSVIKLPNYLFNPADPAASPMTP